MGRMMDGDCEMFSSGNGQVESGKPSARFGNDPGISFGNKHSEAVYGSGEFDHQKNTMIGSGHQDRAVGSGRYIDGGLEVID
jgi:hypothetical protein